MSKRVLVTVALMAAVVPAWQSVTKAVGPFPKDWQTVQDRPIWLGTSGGNIYDRSALYCCSGTLGALVFDGSTYYILSNNHVMALVNDGAVGDPISQPGNIDIGCYPQPEHTVAYLSDFVPIKFAKGRRVPANVVDAAIAEIVPGTVMADGSILGIGPVNSTTVPASIGLNVKKSGRTTGLTVGTVQAIDWSGYVGYSKECGSSAVNRAYFVGQIVITDGSFSDGGDSGSLVVENVHLSPQAVGLLFAGSVTHTLANPIDAVLDSVGVTMDLSGNEPPPPSQTGTITGTVTDKSSGDPIFKATVSVDNGQSAKTDKKGKYTITDVPEGSHDVTASAKRYDPGDQNVKVPAGESVEVNFELASSSNPGAKNAGIAHAIEVKRRNAEKILGLGNVAGVGVGLSGDGRAVIRVYLEKGPTQGRKDIPSKLEDVPVLVEVSGPFVAY